MILNVSADYVGEHFECIWVRVDQLGDSYFEWLWRWFRP